MPPLDLTSASMELREVAAVADRQTRALVEEVDQLGAMREDLVRAASAAMAAGCSLSEIAEAEEHGKAAARADLGPEVLRRVLRSARRLKEAEAERSRAVGQAVGLGLPFRDVGQAAGVSHGTIRAIVGRDSSDGVTNGAAESGQVSPR